MLLAQGPSPVPLASPWVVAPIAGLVILGLTAHLAKVWRHERIAIRRRLRGTNALFMLAGTLAGAYGLAGVAPAAGQRFVFAWTITMALAGAVVIVALADAMVTLRLRRMAEAVLRSRLRDDLKRADPPRGGDDDA